MSKFADKLYGLVSPSVFILYTRVTVNLKSKLIQSNLGVLNRLDCSSCSSTRIIFNRYVFECVVEFNVENITAGYICLLMVFTNIDLKTNKTLSSNLLEIFKF